MKTNLLNAIKLIVADRQMALLTLLMIVVALGYCVYVGISLQPSELQVAVHYTAFGETTFYRDKWYYLISFIVFGLIIAVIHTALVLKLYVQERRQIAMLFAWLSVLLVVIAWTITQSILRVAFL